jgi:hypothetical protein
MIFASIIKNVLFIYEYGYFHFIEKTEKKKVWIFLTLLSWYEDNKFNDYTIIVSFWKKRVLLRLKKFKDNGMDKYEVKIRNGFVSKSKRPAETAGL